MKLRHHRKYRQKTLAYNKLFDWHIVRCLKRIADAVGISYERLTGNPTLRHSR